VHVGCCLIHMHHSGDDILFSKFLFEESDSMFKVLSLFFGRFTADPFRSRSDETILQHDAVFSHPGASFFDLIEHRFPVIPARSYNVIVILCPFRINVRIALILSFQSLVVTADPADRTELPFFYSHDCVVCHDYLHSTYVQGRM